MARKNDKDILEMAGQGCISVMVLGLGLFAVFVAPAAVLGHLVHFLPSISQLMSNHIADPTQKPYPHLVWRFIAADVVLVVVVVGLLRLKRGPKKPVA